MNKPLSSVRGWGLALLFVVAAAVGRSRAAEVIPDAPARYFNDYALTTSSATADKLNRELEDFERQTSNQLLVVIYPKLQTDSDLADYCQRVYRAWKVGQKGTDNGAVLFLFVADHKSHIQTGRGLEGAMPDATCEDILQDKIKPRLQANDWDGAMTAGVEAMMAAAKGEYKGSGRTVYDQQHPNGGDTATYGGLGLGTIFFIIILIFIISRMFRSMGGGGTMYGGGGGPVIFPGSFGGGGGFGGGYGGGSSDSGGFGGGGSSSSDSGSFSAGGGDSAGGGASGDW